MSSAAVGAYRLIALGNSFCKRSDIKKLWDESGEVAPELGVLMHLTGSFSRTISCWLQIIWSFNGKLCDIWSYALLQASYYHRERKLDMCSEGANQLPLHHCAVWQSRDLSSEISRPIFRSVSCLDWYPTYRTLEVIYWQADAWVDVQMSPWLCALLEPGHCRWPSAILDRR
jgi:hypothetical protein